MMCYKEALNVGSSKLVHKYRISEIYKQGIYDRIQNKIPRNTEENQNTLEEDEVVQGELMVQA